eukprot:760340-Hanusia_phi.AAC.2
MPIAAMFLEHILDNHEERFRSQVSLYLTVEALRSVLHDLVGCRNIQTGEVVYVVVARFSCKSAESGSAGCGHTGPYLLCSWGDSGNSSYEGV